MPVELSEFWQRATEILTKPGSSRALRLCLVQRKILLLFLQGGANHTSPAREVTREMQGEFIQPESPGILAPELGNTTLFAYLRIRSLLKMWSQNSLCVAQNPLVFLSKYENCSPPGMCKNTSLIECVLPLWQTLREISNSCVEPGYDWQSLSDPSEITLHVGEVSLEINTIANVQRLKISFPFTFSLSVLHPPPPFSGPSFPHFISSICAKVGLTVLTAHPRLSVRSRSECFYFVKHTLQLLIVPYPHRLQSLPRQAVRLPSHLIPLFFVWSGKVYPDLSCCLFSFSFFHHLLPFCKPLSEDCSSALLMKRFTFQQ